MTFGTTETKNYVKTIPDLILIILAREYPLRIGEITNILKKEFSVNLTFQAIRKSLINLQKRGILTESEKKYQISKEYALETKRLTDQIMSNYFPGSKLGKTKVWKEKNETFTKYNFDNFIKADQFCNEIILEWAHNLKEGDNREYYFQSPHWWYVLAQAGVESSLLTQLSALRVNACCICEGNTLLDKWTKKFYDEHKIKYALDPSPTKTKSSLGVFGDFVIQYDYPSEVYEEIERIYKNARSLDSLNLAKIARLLDSQMKITVSVLNNKIISEKVKKELKMKMKD